MKKVLLLLSVIFLVACSEKHPTCAVPSADVDSTDSSDSADMSSDVSAVDASEDSTKVD